MKKIRSETNDWLRSEYERADLGKIVRGKYAISQVEFAELVALMMACIGEDNDIQFAHHSKGNHLARHKEGDWTYEMDNANQITLRYWLSEYTSIEEGVSNPPCVMSAHERVQLQSLLLHHVLALKARVSSVD